MGAAPVRKLISLGHACEVGFQLRQHSGDNTAQFFDWLGTPAPGLIALVRADFPAFRREDLVLEKPGTRTSVVRHVPTGIGFAHQFPRRGRVIPANFLNDYPSFASRIDYLAARFRRTVRSDAVQFVRRCVTQQEALELEDAMRSTFPSADMRFLYVNADGPRFDTPLGRSVRVAEPRSPFGDSLAWARLLEREGLVEASFRLAPAQIVKASTANNQLAEHDGHPLPELLEGRRRNPENPWFAYELGFKQLRRRRHGAAARLAEEALAAGPDNPDFVELSLRVGVARRKLTRQAALQRALAALGESSHAGLWDFAADLLLSLGRPSEALHHIERGLEARPYSEELWFRKARALRALGRLMEADKTADMALLLRPKAKAHVALKANILRALGRPDEAYALLCDVLRTKRAYRLQILRARLALSPARWRMKQGARQTRAVKEIGRQSVAPGRPRL